MSSAAATLDGFETREARYMRMGLVICFIFFGLIIASTTVIRISGAVSAMGVVVTTGENRPVQHPEGGPVNEVFVADGDLVTQGDLLLVLDSASVDAQQRLLSRQRFELQARLARLEAVATGQDSPEMPDVDGSFPPDEAALILATQQELFDAYRNRVSNDSTRLSTRISGLRSELEASRRQRASAIDQRIILEEEIAEIEDLVAGQLVSKARLTALQRERASVQGQIDALNLSIERTRNALRDAEFDLRALGRQNTDDIWQEIEAAQAQLEEIERSLQATNDRQKRLRITAPATGRVHELSVNTANAVVQPGAVIMEIVPDGAGPLLSTRIMPMDIDQVFPNQEVRVRFDAFDQQTTPEIRGTVARISPDSIADPMTGEVYYEVLVAMSEGEIAALENREVIPGLPATAMFSTGERTLMDYLTKPLRTQMFQAFREG